MDIQELTRAAQADAQAHAAKPASESAYEDVTDPVASGDGRGVCLVTRKRSTGVLYATFRSSRGRDSRYPLAYMGALGFAPVAPEPEAPKAAPKTTAKKAPASK